MTYKFIGISHALVEVTTWKNYRQTYRWSNGWKIVASENKAVWNDYVLPYFSGKGSKKAAIAAANHYALEDGLEYSGEVML